MTELLTVILIFALLITLAIPSYRDMVSNNCIVSYNHTLISAIQLARSEAVKRSASINVTAISSNWGFGLNVWEDDGDGTMQTAEVIREMALSCGDATITESGGDTEFVFNTTGGVDATGSFNICDGRTGERGSQVSFTVTGRPSSSQITCP